jgi:hypothetical protein
MLVALFESVLVALVGYVYGRAVLAGMARLAWTSDELGESPPHFPEIALFGLAVLSAGAGVWALFGPLRGAAFAVALAGAAALGAARPRWLREGLGREAAELRAAGPLGWVLLGLGAAFILARTTNPVDNYDSGTYHAPVIRWLEEIGYVPGLGNLHGRLTYSPGWFSLSALFSLGWLGGRSLHVLVGALALLLLLWGVTALGAWRRGERRGSLLLRLALPLLVLRLGGKWLSSPTPDLAVATLVWVVGALGLEVAEDAATAKPELLRRRGDPRFLAITLLAAWAVTVKLSALPLLVLPLLVAAGRLADRRGREVLVAAGAAAVVIAPAVVEAVVTTGYLVFPLPGLAAFPVDWALPPEVAADYVRVITAWARLPHRPPEEVLALPFAEWLGLWWEKVRWPVSGLLLAVVMLAPLRAGAALVRSVGGRGARKRAEASSAPTHAGHAGGTDGIEGIEGVTGRSAALRRLLPRAAVHLTVWAGTLFWFTTAPDPRFGLGFVALLPLLLALPWLGAALRRVTAGGLAALVLAALLWEAWQVHGWEPHVFPAAAHHALVPADYPVPEVRTVRLDGLDVQVPVINDQCWYASFPCTPFPDPRLELRGPRLREGFRRSSR